MVHVETNQEPKTNINKTKQIDRFPPLHNHMSSLLNLNIRDKSKMLTKPGIYLTLKPNFNIYNQDLYQHTFIL